MILILINLRIYVSQSLFPVFIFGYLNFLIADKILLLRIINGAINFVVTNDTYICPYTTFFKHNQCLSQCLFC